VQKLKKESSLNQIFDSTAPLWQPLGKTKLRKEQTPTIYRALRFKYKIPVKSQPVNNEEQTLISCNEYRNFI